MSIFAYGTGTASITVAGTGVIRELTYDSTVATATGSRRRAATDTIDDVGTTTVTAPSWLQQAREQGVRVRASLADDRATLVCDVVNGRIPAGTEVQLTTNLRVARGTLGQALTAGDTVALGISEADTLLIGHGGVPEQASRLGTAPYAAFRTDGFLLANEGVAE